MNFMLNQISLVYIEYQYIIKLILRPKGGEKYENNSTKNNWIKE